MDNMDNMIYIRTHLSYENTYKMGMTANLLDRDKTYATGELKRGEFISVFEVKNVKLVDNLLKNSFSHLNIKHNGGTEFFDKQILNLIEPFFIENNIQYIKLRNFEIARKIGNFKLKSLIKKHKIQKLTPRYYQDVIIYKSIEYFKTNNKGILALICGTGKTLISLWISKKLQSETILIGVPSLILLYQWEESIKKIFHNSEILINVNVSETIINDFLDRKGKFLITTYHSSHKIDKICREKQFVFSLKIYDECHHLTTKNLALSETKNSFIKILNIPSHKTLSLTATLKNLTSNKLDNELSGSQNNIISNDDEVHFGKVIDEKTISWAISKKIICDYEIQVLLETEELNSLQLSAYAALKSIKEGNSHHNIIYTNNKKNSKIVKQHIQEYLQNVHLQDVFFEIYDSSSENQEDILKNFKESKYGIIICVFCLGEGWDFKVLDCVIIAEKMSSTIRIIQSLLRANRKNEDEPDKKSKIILPISYKDYKDKKSSEFGKIMNVIRKMSYEDERITQKIKVSVNEVSLNLFNDTSLDLTIEDIKKLTTELLLITIPRNELILSFTKAKLVLKKLNIKTKAEYYELVNRDTRFIEDPHMYKQFVNWIDYLGIQDTFYDIKNCKLKIQQYLNINMWLKQYNLDLVKICEELHTMDVLFPPAEFWIDYYKIKDLRELIILTNNKKKRVLLD